VKRLAALAVLALAAYVAHSSYWAWLEDNRQGR
jgi:hypothetical protein